MAVQCHIFHEYCVIKSKVIEREGSKKYLNSMQPMGIQEHELKVVRKVNAHFFE
jgi:hypothetical protein